MAKMEETPEKLQEEMGADEAEAVDTNIDGEKVESSEKPKKDETSREVPGKAVKEEKKKAEGVEEEKRKKAETSKEGKEKKEEEPKLTKKEKREKKLRDKEEKEREEQFVEEHIYTIPLRKHLITPPKRKSKRAIKIIRTYIHRHMNPKGLKRLSNCPLPAGVLYR